VPRRNTPVPSLTGGGVPLVVAEDVHVTYSVVTSAPPTHPVGRVGSLVRKYLRPVPTTHVSAVRGVSFVVSAGESIGIIGSNGSGKSSLLRAVAGLRAPEKGRIYAAQTPVLLGVNSSLLTELPGSANVTLSCLAMGLSQAQVDERFDDIVELAGIGDAIHLPMRTYSSGMAARLKFAIATAVRPHILLLDEALSTGDAAFRERSKERMDELREQAGCVFIVNHSSSAILESCTRVLWLERGVLGMDGDPQEVVGTYVEHQRAVASARRNGRTAPMVPWAGESTDGLGRALESEA
jgi:teichoic acid transport system ATP-binding protein